MYSLFPFQISAQFSYILTNCLTQASKQRTIICCWFIVFASLLALFAVAPFCCVWIQFASSDVMLNVKTPVIKLNNMHLHLSLHSLTRYCPLDVLTPLITHAAGSSVCRPHCRLRSIAGGLGIPGRKTKNQLANTLVFPSAAVQLRGHISKNGRVGNKKKVVETETRSSGSNASRWS